MALAPLLASLVSFLTSTVPCGPLSFSGITVQEIFTNLSVTLDVDIGYM